MMLKSAHFITEQKVFNGRPMVSVMPDRDGVELEMAGDWVLVRSLKGETKGRVALIHGSRFFHVEPDQDPSKDAKVTPSAQVQTRK